MKQVPLLLIVFVIFGTFRSEVLAEDISTAGWRLWPDQTATWKNDTLYLPSEVQLNRMPVNAPTGGWQVLNDQQGVPVLLPSTVEEHYWGKFGTRPYASNEAQKGPKTSFPNGNYLGVSWWWREIQIPHFRKGQRIIVSLRGARLRAEVYCNGKLCGYTIMTELPFEADLTDAVKPGQSAQLAIRITNPGGNLDWIDFPSSRIYWGKYMLPPSHGFGGLDSDIQLSVRDDVSVTDLAVINTPDLHLVHLIAEIKSNKQSYNGKVLFQISRNGETVWTADQTVTINPGETKTVEVDAQVDSAQPWDLQHPNLYQAIATLSRERASGKNVNFGFRFFTAQGIGSDDAILTLNDKRIVILSAISWGYWGRNGLWPDQEMAEREVSDAKTLGLNCLQFHRNIGKPAVLDIQDREGLLRYEEPGAGKFAFGSRYARGPFNSDGNLPVKGDQNDSLASETNYIEPEVVDTSGSGPEGDAVTFWEKYEEEKILEMVKRDRSHPSLIMYSIQNESSDIDLRNPRIYRIFREIHALDPSRIIVCFSGANTSTEVLMLPYSTNIAYGSKSIHYAGWRDIHTCGGPCNYLDNLYTNPTNFVQLSKVDDHKEICMWGETLGAAVPDDYDQIVHSFDTNHPSGYELSDMTQILDGYHEFLDKWGFRKAFPTDSSLFQAIGYREYYFWQRIIEQTRADNANDYLVISGWESTTIDNHSGLVDNHRFFKGDPRVIAKACQPEVLFIQPRHMIVAKGNNDLADVFLLNETNLCGPQILEFTVKNPDGSTAFTTNEPVNAIGGNTYGQLLQAGIEFRAADAGIMNLEATLRPVNSTDLSLTGKDQVEVIDVTPAPLLKSIALIESGREISNTLSQVFHIAPIEFSTGLTNHLDAIVLSTEQNTLAPKISDSLFDSALDAVKNNGTRLVLWPDNETSADSFAKALARRRVIEYSGLVGNLGAPWFGSWYFVRKHWLLNGLPVDCAMDWRYGISAFNGPTWLHSDPPHTNTNGLLLDAPNLKVLVGYGADHNPKVGISGCVIPYGKGQIVLYCLPQLARSLQPGNFAINPVIAQRLLGNALQLYSGPANDN